MQSFIPLLSQRTRLYHRVIFQTRPTTWRRDVSTFKEIIVGLSTFQKSWLAADCPISCLFTVQRSLLSPYSILLSIVSSKNSKGFPAIQWVIDTLTNIFALKRLTYPNVQPVSTALGQDPLCREGSPSWKFQLSAELLEFCLHLFLVLLHLSQAIGLLNRVF